MKLRIFPHALSMLLASLLVLSCSQSDDGPLEALPPDTSQSGGEGFYFRGNLDSGAIYHPVSDSIRIHLDSLWILSDCGLDSFQRIMADTAGFAGDSAFDALAESGRLENSFYLKPLIHIPLESNCADLRMNYNRSGDDSVFLMAPFWEEELRELILLADNPYFLGRYPITDSGAYIPGDNDKRIADTILLRHGTLNDTVLLIPYDSVFYEKDFQDHAGGSSDLGYLRRIYEIKTYDQILKLYPQSCLGATLDCETIEDTVLAAETNINSEGGDTLLAYRRPTCTIDTLRYCTFGDWQIDSTQLEYVPFEDSIWVYQEVVGERLAACDYFNRWSFANRREGRNDSLDFYREIMSFDASREDCREAPTLRFIDVFGDSLLGDSLTTVLEGEWESHF